MYRALCKKQILDLHMCANVYTLVHIICTYEYVCIY